MSKENQASKQIAAYFSCKQLELNTLCDYFPEDMTFSLSKSS